MSRSASQFSLMEVRSARGKMWNERGNFRSTFSSFGFLGAGLDCGLGLLRLGVGAIVELLCVGVGCDDSEVVSLTEFEGALCCS